MSNSYSQGFITHTDWLTDSHSFIRSPRGEETSYLDWMLTVISNEGPAAVEVKISTGAYYHHYHHHQTNWSSSKNTDRFHNKREINHQTLCCSEEELLVKQTTKWIPHIIIIVITNRKADTFPSEPSSQFNMRLLSILGTVLALLPHLIQGELNIHIHTSPRMALRNCNRLSIYRILND